MSNVAQSLNAPECVTVVVAAPQILQRKYLSQCFAEQGGFTLVRCSSLEEVLSTSHISRVVIISHEQMRDPQLEECLNSRGTRILVVGSKTDQAVVQYIVRAGCAGFLESDCSDQTLQRAVRSVSAGELWASRTVVSRIVQDLLSPERLQLSRRECEILRLVGLGYKNREIAEQLCISCETVRWHLRGLYTKIKVKDRPSAVRYAVGCAGIALRNPVVLRQKSRTFSAAG